MACALMVRAEEHREMVLDRQLAANGAQLPCAEMAAIAVLREEEVAVLPWLGRKLVQDVWTDLTTWFPLARGRYTF